MKLTVKVVIGFSLLFLLLCVIVSSQGNVQQIKKIRDNRQATGDLCKGRANFSGPCEKLTVDGTDRTCAQFNGYYVSDTPSYYPCKLSDGSDTSWVKDGDTTCVRKDDDIFNWKSHCYTKFPPDLDEKKAEIDFCIQKVPFSFCSGQNATWDVCKNNEQGAYGYCANQETADYNKCKSVKQSENYCLDNKKARSPGECANDIDDLNSFCRGPNAKPELCSSERMTGKDGNILNPRSSYCTNSDLLNSLTWEDCKSTIGTESDSKSSYGSPAHVFCESSKKATFEECSSLKDETITKAFCTYNNSATNKSGCPS